MNDLLPAWTYTWRHGIAPCLPLNGLRALERALRRNDYNLIQGQCTAPASSSPEDAELLCFRACAIGFCYLATHAGPTKGEVEAFFAEVVRDCNQALGEPAASRHFFNWYDGSTREEAFRLLLTEVQYSIRVRTRHTKAVA